MGTDERDCRTVSIITVSVLKTSGSFQRLRKPDAWGVIHLDTLPRKAYDETR